MLRPQHFILHIKRVCLNLRVDTWRDHHVNLSIYLNTAKQPKALNRDTREARVSPSLPLLTPHPAASPCLPLPPLNKSPSPPRQMTVRLFFSDAWRRLRPTCF